MLFAFQFVLIQIITLCLLYLNFYIKENTYVKSLLLIKNMVLYANVRKEGKSMLEIIEETLIDSIKILPFLFITYLIMEYIEHKTKNRTKETIKIPATTVPAFKAGKALKENI